jgi:hypothetical protein
VAGIHSYHHRQCGRMGHSYHARSNPTRMRRIGILIEATADPDLRSCVEPFVSLRELGWTGGRNVQN